MENEKEPKKDSVVIPKKALLGIICTFPLFGILISRGEIGPLILFIIGIVLGLFIGKAFFENKK